MSARRGTHVHDPAVPAERPRDRTPLRSLHGHPVDMQVSVSSEIGLPPCSVRMKCPVGPVLINGTVIPGDEEEHFKENVVPDVRNCNLGSPSLDELALYGLQSRGDASVTAFDDEEEDSEGSNIGNAEPEHLDDGTSRETVSEVTAADQCDHDGVGYITLKSFICSGVQVEISDDTRFSEETFVPLPEDHDGETHCLSEVDSENCGNLTLFSDSIKHEDHIYAQVGKFRSHLESILSDFVLPASLNESETKAPENEEDIFCENLSEFLSVNLEDLTSEDNCCLGPASGGSSESITFETSVPSIPVHHSSCWKGSEEDEAAQSGADALSSTPLRLVPPGDLLAGLPNESLETNAAHGASVPSDKCPSNDKSESKHCGEISADPLRSASTPPKLNNSLMQNAYREELNQNFDVPQGAVGDGFQEGEKCSVTPACMDAIPTTPEKQEIILGRRVSSLWNETSDSPMPLPCLNSTALSSAPCCQTTQPEDRKAIAPDLPPAHLEPLQQQLLKMMELFILKSGNVPTGAAAVQTSFHNVATETSLMHRAEHSVNTSGIFELKKEIIMAEASTSTDSLLWTQTPVNLELASREELQQRVTSLLIMVEVLSQQLTSVWSQRQSPGLGPSDLREKLVQTDHTELNQVLIYKELYEKTLGKIRSLELDQETTKKLLDSMKDARAAMTAVHAETEESLANLTEIPCMTREDQDGISRLMKQMRELNEKWKEMLRKMSEKIHKSIQERNQMQQIMEEAVRAKEAAFGMMEQLRVQHANKVAKLEETVGSHVTVQEALTKALLEQASFSEEHVKSLEIVNEVLDGSMSYQTSLHEELSRTRQLLQKANPLMQKMHEKMAAAFREAKKQEEERNQAVEEKNKIQDELTQTVCSLQNATQKISDLSLHVTILNSEITGLRQQLNQAEEEYAELQMKNTELSAVASTTQASYAFLQQALASETHKLQQSAEEARKAAEEIRSLDAALKESCWQLEEKTQMLAKSEQTVAELRSQAQVHIQQLEQLHELQEQLVTLKEMNEYLQAENELSQEQVAESEALLRSHLQGLRERNLECEDLKRELFELRQERESLLEELDSTQSKARTMLLDMGEQLSQASVDVAVLHHRVHGLTSALQTVLHPSNASNQSVTSQPSAQTPHQTAKSFLDTVMVAISCEEDQGTNTGLEESQEEGMGGGASAFARFVPTTPKKEQDAPAEEEQSNVLQLLSGLGDAFSELISTISQLREVKAVEQQELEHTVCSLQGELQALSVKHRSEVADLKAQMQRLQVQVDKGAEALQHKVQEEKTLKKLCSEMDQNRELLQQQRRENNELRQEVAGLRRSLQQAEIEVQVLREELSRTGSRSGQETFTEKLELRKEVDKLKRNLMEVEESRSKLLERAKRHQLVYETNQKKLERELHLLDKMIDTVRETLSSIPAAVQNCEELQKLVKYLA